MKHCPNPDCHGLAKFKIVSEFNDTATICSDCQTPLVDGPAPRPEELGDRPEPDPNIELVPILVVREEAKLVLIESDKPLESGVELMIHPPGKKLTRLSLLSGGEKALSAIAFIFSIFLIKPASFCLLDEIDAPLDDANVFRFNDLLQIIGENSQIIVITHNKRTMEFADMLFGITMEQKGISKVVSVNFLRQ